MKKLREALRKFVCRQEEFLHSGRSSLLIACCVTAACGGGGGGGGAAPTQFDALFNEAEELASQFELAGFSDPSNIPTSGSAQFEGVVLLQLSDTTDRIFDRAACRVNIDVTFDGSTIVGSAQSFVDGNGIGIAGQLDISSGTIDRMGDPNVEATVGFEMSGQLTDNLIGEVDFALDFDGDFFGDQLDALGGSISGIATAGSTEQLVGGALISEKR